MIKIERYLMMQLGKIYLCFKLLKSAVEGKWLSQQVKKSQRS